MTVLLGTILSPSGLPVTGSLYLQLSQDANLLGGPCGRGAVAALPPNVFNLVNGLISGPGPGAYTVPGANCLTPSGLTYHMTVTGPGGAVILERDISITGASVDLGTLGSVAPSGLAPVPAIFNPITSLTANWNAGHFRIDSNNSTREINVAAYATGGAGTSGSPWTGWDTACPWAANTTFHFPKGQYDYSTPPAVSLDGIRLVGEGLGTVLNFLGTGNAWVFAGGPAPGDPRIKNLGMQGFLIQGTATATNGIFARGVDFSYFRDIYVKDVSGAGFLSNFMIASLVEKFSVSQTATPMTTFPVNGIILTQRGAGETTISCLVSDVFIEGATGTGIILAGAANNQLVSCVSTLNNRGIEVAGAATGNSITNFHGEGNVVEDILLEGLSNTFVQPFCSNAVSIHVSGIYAIGNQFYGGHVNGVIVDAGPSGNAFNGLWYGTAGGAFTDNGTKTGVLNVWNVTAAAYIPNVIRGGLTVSGKLATTGSTVTLVNGANENVVVTSSWVLISGPTGAFGIGGVAGGYDGQIVTFQNVVPYAMTIYYNDAGSAAGNKIMTSTQANVVGGGYYNCFTLQYDGTNTRWILTGHNS